MRRRVRARSAAPAAASGVKVVDLAPTAADVSDDEEARALRSPRLEAATGAGASEQPAHLVPLPLNAASGADDSASVPFGPIPSPPPAAPTHRDDPPAASDAIPALEGAAADGDVPVAIALLRCVGVARYAVCYNVLHEVLCAQKAAEVAWRETAPLLCGLSGSPADLERSVVPRWRELLRRAEAAAVAALTEIVAAAAIAAQKRGVSPASGGGLNGGSAEDEEVASCAAAVLQLAAAEGFEEGMTKTARAFRKTLERSVRTPLGYSYRVRPPPPAAAAAPAEEKVGCIVRVPAPQHHRRPDVINTQLQCTEPRQRKRLLEDHAILSHPRRATAAGVEDFLVKEQVRADALATIAQHLQLRDSLRGLPVSVNAVLLDVGLEGNTAAFRLRGQRDRGLTPQVRQRVHDALLRHAAAHPALRASALEVATMCHVALWFEEAQRAAATATSMLRASDRGGLTRFGLRDGGSVGSAAVELPNPLSDSFTALLRAVLDDATLRHLDALVMPMLRAGAAQPAMCGSAVRVSQMGRSCPAPLRSELARLVRDTPLTAGLPTLMRSSLSPTAGASDEGGGATQGRVAFPITARILHVLEALAALGELMEPLVLATPGASLDAGAAPAIVLEAQRALPGVQGWGNVAALAEWALGHPVFGSSIAGARVAAVPLLADCIAVRVAAMMRDSSSRRAAALTIAFEEYMRSTASCGSALHRCAPELVDAVRVHALYAAVRAKEEALHGPDAVRAGHHALPSVFLLEVPAASASSVSTSTSSGISGAVGSPQVRLNPLRVRAVSEVSDALLSPLDPHS